MKNKKILIFLIISLIFSGIIFSCGDGKKQKKRRDNHNLQINHQKELKQTTYSFENPPEFRKDGELIFTDNFTGEMKSKIDIEIASTDFQRQLGLMYRAEMDFNRGMLFLFDREQLQSFWMRNTLIPLDIIYVNSRREIVDILTATEILSDNSYPSSAPAVYVVEVNAGYCELHGITNGDKIIF